MDNNVSHIETLYGRAIDYSKTSYELAKLKILDKASDAVSSYMPHAFVFALIALFMLFFNLGLAFWLGKILGNIYYGFFVVAAFYLFVAGFVHFFLHKWLKKLIGNYIVKQALK